MANGGKLPERLQEQRAQVVESVIKAIERDGLRWTQPWTGLASPRNAVSGHVYHGINRASVMTLSLKRHYRDPRFLTFNQIKQAGRRLKRGSKSIAIEKWTLLPIDKDDPQSRTVPRCVGYYNVFNIGDVEGEPWPDDQPLTPMPVSALTQAADRLIASSRCEVREDKVGSAFYSPSLDLIHMPTRDSFKNDEYFVRTLLHEMTHSTAPAVHRTVAPGGFGSMSYAREELVAELGAMFAMSGTGIRADLDDSDPYWQQHTAYLQSWTRALQDAPHELYRAAAQAEKAADYLVERYLKVTNERKAA